MKTEYYGIAKHSENNRIGGIKASKEHKMKLKNDGDDNYRNS